jgi:hypothetical protein
MPKNPVYVFTNPDNPGEMTHIHRTCIHCNETYTIYLPSSDYKMWRDGAYVQQAFSYLSPEKREMLVSGTHPSCFDIMFADAD